MIVNENNQAEAKKFKAAIARARKLATEYRESYQSDDREEVERLRMRMINARNRVSDLDRFVDGQAETAEVWTFVREAWESRDVLRGEFLTNESKRLHAIARQKQAEFYAYR